MKYVRWWKVKLQYVLGVGGVNVAKFHFIADTSSSEPEDRFTLPSPRATLLARLKHNQCSEQMCVRISSTPLCDDEKTKSDTSIWFANWPLLLFFFFFLFVFPQTREQKFTRTTNTALAVHVRAFLRCVRVDSGTGDRQRDSVHASGMDSRGWCRD